MTGALPPVNSPAAIDGVIGDGQMLPRDTRGNAGLVFDRYLKIWEPGQIREPLKQNRQRPLAEFCGSYEGLGATGRGLLGSLHRRFEMLETPAGQARGGWACHAATFKTRWRVVTGVGNEHPLENGFTFDRSIGAPFFPGSGVKGLCRAAAGQLMDASPDELDLLFGSQPELTHGGEDVSAGDLVFFPAYPARDHWPRLEVDIINNHHPSYTRALADPRLPPQAVETDSPIPVFFLTVAAQTPFTFRIGSRSGSADNVAAAFRALAAGLDLLGLGAKTAVGYGMFLPPEGARSGVTDMLVLERIALENLRPFRDLKMTLAGPRSPGHGQWAVILGENGVGKTTLLRAIALALIDVSDPAILPREALATAWRRHGIEPDAAAKVTLVAGGSTISTEVHLQGDRERLRQATPPPPQPLFAYGCRRGSALGGSARDVSYDPGAEIATLFDEGASLIHAETWLALRHGAAADDPKGARQRLFDTVIETLIGLLPDVERIWIEDMRVMVSGPSVGKVPLAALSDGYLTTTGWVLDLIARWVDQAERRGDTIEPHFNRSMRGMVLIDEIDLHLHPTWQRSVIADLRAMFPQMSFIVTTHNPLTLLGARAEEIWKLERDDAGGIVAIQGHDRPELLTGSELYNSYFGITSLFPSELGEKLERYGTLARSAVRTETEEAEMHALLAALREGGVEPGIQPVEVEQIPPYPDLEST